MAAVPTAVVTLAGAIQPAIDAIACAIQMRRTAEVVMAGGYCRTAIEAGFDRIAATIQATLDAVAMVRSQGITGGSQPCQQKE
jgi:hypothetical protein